MATAPEDVLLSCYSVIDTCRFAVTASLTGKHWVYGNRSYHVTRIFHVKNLLKIKKRGFDLQFLWGYEWLRMS